MTIRGIIWLGAIVEKLAAKHQVQTHEALILSAREMASKERQQYAKK
jgi:uncharacterized DUF497 family protein